MKPKEPFIPGYAVAPLLLVPIFNFSVYYVSRLITTPLHHYCFKLPIDDWIGFFPPLIIIYIGAYVQWIIGFLLIAKESREVCDWLFSSEVIAKTITFALFLLIPTTIDRPEIYGTNIYSVLLNNVYLADPPDNLFPSIHCLESWMCYRSCKWLTKVPKWYTPASLIMTLLVFASTVCLRQHVFVDILGGILMVEIGLRLSRVLNADRMFQKIRELAILFHRDEKQA